MPNTRAIGHAYRVQVMHLLTRFGYASTRQLAMCLFGDTSDNHRKHLNRIVRWLLKHRFVVARRDGNNINAERLIALTQKGVAALGCDIELIGGKSHGRDWLRHCHPHRSASNSVWAACHHGKGSPGWTELEISGGLAPSSLSPFRYRMANGLSLQKVPDLLLTNYAGQRFSLPVWVEVENSWRNAKDLTKLVGFLRAMFYQTSPQLYQAWFVVTSNGARSIIKRLKAALTHTPEANISATIRKLDAHLLAERIKFYELCADCSLSAIRL